MPQGWLWAPVFAVGLGLAILVHAVPGRSAELPQAEQEMLLVLERTAGGNLDPISASDSCVSYFSAAKDVERMRHTVVGLLQVRPDEALAAACKALIKSTAAGDYSAERFRALSLSEYPETNLLEFGRFMRAIFFAHSIGPAFEPSGAQKP